MKFRNLFSGLSNRERAFAYATVAVVFIVSMERLVYYPIVSRLNELEQEILVTETHLRRNVRELAAGEAVRAAYAAYTPSASKAGSEDEEVARLLNEIEGLARKAGLSLGNMKPKPAGRIDVGKLYPVEVELESSMAPLMKFLHSLHGSKYLLRVQQLHLVPKGGRSAEVKVYLVINETVIQ
jgi:type II secretory pathway component PulM